MWNLLECLTLLAVLHFCPLHAAIGRTPVISLDEDTLYGFKVSCVSGGWYPKPDLQWTDGRGQVITAMSETSEEQDGEGLYTVRSYLRTPKLEGGQVSCVIKYGEDQRELRSSAKIVGDSVPSLPGWRVSSVLLSAAFISVLLFIGISLGIRRSCSWRRYKIRPVRLF
ncbi:butyrophilin-like protein 1 isoform X2 [Polyodon spathula]|uniref:butyrophilin-like protein 1 isoform X2 n=1 Tax=Polyodon spathula TaxID=7913 RepID=UPI001B7DCFD1|nr:butyrophilin-like protein 1 isoform X2 [Polyodon spathula]